MHVLRTRFNCVGRRRPFKWPGRPNVAAQTSRLSRRSSVAARNAACYPVMVVCSLSACRPASVAGGRCRTAVPYECCG